MMYNPAYHYWLATNGRVYSGPLQNIVTESDPGYIAFIQAGDVATPWPVDTEGNQTEAELQAVLRPYGMFVNLSYYTSDARQRKYAGDITVNGLPFSTDPISLGGLNAAMLYTSDKQVNAFAWKLPDGTFITLDQLQIKDLQSTVAAFGQACFLCEDETLTGIESGTITTRAQVDGAFAAVSSVFTSPATFGATRHGPRK